MFLVWINELLLANPAGIGEHITQSELDTMTGGVCGEFLPAPFFAQFWIFLKNLFNPITWDLIFSK